MNTKFIILTTQRTGSTLLWRYLDGHPEISAHGEMFLNKLKRNDSYSYYRRKSIENQLSHYLNKRKSINQYLKKLYNFRNGIKSIGFKLMYAQNSSILNEWIEKNNISIIHLIRTNVLKMIVSRECLKKRKIHHIKPGEKVKSVKIHLKPQKTIKTIKTIMAEIESHRNKFSHGKYLEITYEDFTADIEKSSLEIFEFLGVDSIDNLPIPLKKINPKNLNIIIENYDDIAVKLAGTPYESFLD